MEAVDYVKLRESGSYHHYMMVRLHENDLRREGAHDARVETARKLKSKNFSLEEISEITELSANEIAAL